MAIEHVSDAAGVVRGVAEVAPPRAWGAAVDAGHRAGPKARQVPTRLQADWTPRITLSCGVAGVLAIDATVARDVDVSVRFGPERLAGAFQPA